MREIGELRGLTAGRLLALWRECREKTEDPLEQSLLCNARILAECCYLRGERVYSDEAEVLEDLTGRQMETLLRRLAEDAGTPEAEGTGASVNPGFDEERFARLREE